MQNQTQLQQSNQDQYLDQNQYIQNSIYQQQQQQQQLQCQSPTMSYQSLLQKQQLLNNQGQNNQPPVSPSLPSIYKMSNFSTNSNNNNNNNNNQFNNNSIGSNGNLDQIQNYQNIQNLALNGIQQPNSPFRPQLTGSIQQCPSPLLQQSFQNLQSPTVQGGNMNNNFLKQIQLQQIQQQQQQLQQNQQLNQQQPSASGLSPYLPSFNFSFKNFNNNTNNVGSPTQPMQPQESPLPQFYQYQQQLNNMQPLQSPSLQYNQLTPSSAMQNLNYNLNSATPNQHKRPLNKIPTKKQLRQFHVQEMQQIVQNKQVQNQIEEENKISSMQMQTNGSINNNFIIETPKPLQQQNQNFQEKSIDSNESNLKNNQRDVNYNSADLNDSSYNNLSCNNSYQNSQNNSKQEDQNILKPQPKLKRKINIGPINTGKGLSSFGENFIKQKNDNETNNENDNNNINTNNNNINNSEERPAQGLIKLNKIDSFNNNSNNNNEINNTDNNNFNNNNNNNYNNINTPESVNSNNNNNTQNEQQLSKPSILQKRGMAQMQLKPLQSIKKPQEDFQENENNKGVKIENKDNNTQDMSINSALNLQQQYPKTPMSITQFAQNNFNLNQFQNSTNNGINSQFQLLTPTTAQPYEMDSTLRNHQFIQNYKQLQTQTNSPMINLQGFQTPLLNNNSYQDSRFNYDQNPYNNYTDEQIQQQINHLEQLKSNKQRQKNLQNLQNQQNLQNTSKFQVKTEDKQITDIQTDNTQQDEDKLMKMSKNDKKKHIQQQLQQLNSTQSPKKKRGQNIQVDKSGYLPMDIYKYHQNDILTGHVPTNFMNLLLPYLIRYYQKHLKCKITKGPVSQECKCEVCTEFQNLRNLHNLKKNKSIQSFVNLWQTERIRILSEDFILFYSQQQIMGKDTYRNPKNKISLLYCLKNLLGAVKEPAVFHKLL